MHGAIVPKHAGALKIVSPVLAPSFSRCYKIVTCGSVTSEYFLSFVSMEEQSDGDVSDSENLALEQRFKAAIHYTVGKICSELEEQMEITFSKHTIAVIAEATYKQSGIFASDLEDFCQHAKRTTVTADDVKLLARRSGTLAQHISKVHKKMKNTQVATKEKKGQKRKKAGP